MPEALIDMSPSLGPVRRSSSVAVDTEGRAPAPHGATHLSVRWSARRCCSSPRPTAG